MATMRQKKAVEKLVENNGNVSRAMLDAGYSPATAKNPSVLTEAKGFHQLLEDTLKKHNITVDTAISPIGKALKATKQNEYTGEIVEDLPTQLKASDRALKLMGYYNRDNQNTINNFGVIVQQQKDKYKI